MAWDENQLAAATASILASQLLIEIENNLSSDSSNSRRLNITVEALSRGCEKEIDEEAKIIQIVDAIKAEKGWNATIYHRLGVVEFYE